MIKISQNILIQYLIWHFFDVPKSILNAWKNFLLFNLNYFSLSLLFKTLFSHWHKYQWYYGRGFDIKGYLEVFFSNSLSRVLGAVMRSILIIIGLMAEVFIIFLGLIVFLIWLVLPIILIYGLYFGIKVLF